MRLAIVSATALLAMGCSKAPEGINTGECVDLMDNDVDGLVDCFDPDCVAAGACGDVDTTTPADPGDTQDTQDTPPITGGGENCAGDTTAFLHGAMSDATVEYSVRFQLSGLTASLCDLDPAMCDCTAIYNGTGDFMRAGGNEALFRGTWEKVSDECTEIPGYGRLTDAIWANGNIEVYHMFTWSGDGSRLDQWVTYAQEEGCDLLTPTDALVFGQFYISQMAASYDAGGKSVSYAASDVTTEGLIQIETTNTLDVVFR
jgi:hypothetical protein